LFHVEGGNKENIVARITGGRREMGASALRRDFNARVNSSDEFNSSSIAFLRRSRDSAELVSMKVAVDTVFKVKRVIACVTHSELRQNYVTLFSNKILTMRPPG
jgi:hypothetical protein